MPTPRCLAQAKSRPDFAARAAAGSSCFLQLCTSAHAPAPRLQRPTPARLAAPDRRTIDEERRLPWRHLPPRNSRPALEPLASELDLPEGRRSMRLAPSLPMLLEVE